MNWTLTAQILAIVVAYVGGILAIGRFMTHSLGKRLDDMNANINARFNDVNKRINGLDKRMDEMNANINARFNDVNKRIDGLDKRMDEMNANVNARFNDMNGRIDDLRSQMHREHDALSRKLDAHIDNQQIHQSPRV